MKKKIRTAAEVVANGEHKRPFEEALNQYVLDF